MPHDPLDSLRAALGARYAVERELGSGGMATVYLARDLRHDRMVAIKVFRPELAAAIGPERFLREVAIAASLNHPHILGVHDSGDADGLLYFVMPAVEGASLRQRLQHEGQLGVDEALEITVDVAAALEYAHARGVVHRDIKPENILLHEGEAMLADFGIALGQRGTDGSRLTEAGLALGTPEYMSPEQATGEPTIDGRSDVFSLACVLFEMLSGRPPFTGPTAQAAIAARLVDPVPSVRRHRPAVPGGVDRALAQALARVPADRFASARAFADALRAPAPPAAATPSVAVLPFRNLSPDQENEYFADGITEDVIAHLSKIRSLKVISRTSVMAFKRREQTVREIGRALGVATVMDGSVRRAGDRVRIVAQLIDANTDEHLWTETYDRQLTDIFEIQTDVALRIAAALKAELSLDEETRIAVEPTHDIHAYELYLQGREAYRRFTETGLHQGIELFEQALVRDPHYALAQAAIALAWVELTTQGGRVEPLEAYERAERAARRALAMDARLGEAHGVLGTLKLMRDFDWAGSEAEFQRALELSPGSADILAHYGWLCGALARHDQSLALVERARELDPLVIRADHATALLRAGRYADAVEAARRSVELEPEYARAHATLGWAQLLHGARDEGVQELERAAALSPDATTWIAQLGQAYGMVGRRADAQAALQRLDTLSQERYVSPYHRAYVYTGLGDHDTAVEWLERAFDERAAGVYNIKGSFLFTALHGHPRFAALLRKMNLPA